ncbi:PQQ-binding-like beta-propeller repeat protein, partial [bacterium AH-315-J21]|nr:PQQ-binding-like beta-propeller repeat protein [bacterium AH-315-J21]
HDQQRTGASFNALGEANCNLNLIWSAQGGPNSFSGSVIFGDKVLISDDAGMDCRLLLDGSLVWDQDTDPTVSGLFAGALGNRTQPTVATVGVVQMAFLGTGLNRDVVAVDAQTGAYIWHNTTNSPFPGLAPNATNVKTIVLNDGVDDVLYYATQKKVYAVLAATGAVYAPWTVNPFSMVADNINALTTNDTAFASSQIVSPVFSGAIAGDVYALDAATGSLIWSLSGRLGTAGLQADVDALAGYIGNEGFFSGASYDKGNDVYWVNSYLDADFPEEGYLYRIPSDSAGTIETAKSVRSQRATPAIDENQIYVPAFTKWLSPVTSGEQIFSRTTGNLIGGMEGNIAGDRQWGDGVLTCEPGTDDYWIHGTENGELNFYQVGLVNSLQFYRETSAAGFVSGQWNSGSMTVDAVLFTTFGGLTVALGPGANRPRLTLPVGRQDLPVPFGTPNGFDATFPAVIGNSGCADLTINGITFTDPTPPSGTVIEFSAVDAVLRAKMSERADFTTNSSLFEKFGLMFGEAPAGVVGTYDNNTVSSSLNFRAAVLPDVVDGTTGDNGLISPSVGALVAPGDIVDLHVAINGPNVTRGPHDFTAHVDTDDPDYYLDDPLGIPTVALRVIGGCLEDSVLLTFGIGGANSVIVFNDALVQRYSSDGHASLDIDGFDASGEFFSGIRGWSMTPMRMAWSGQAWDFGGGWQTILAEENYCTNECLPTLKSDVLLGSISTDNGATYTDVFGDLVGLSYIDSARDYTGGGGAWDWQSNPDAFLPDSTIGMLVDETHYGAKDVLGLNNIQLIRFDVTNRSAVNSIDDLQHFAVHDDDLSGTDHMLGGASFGYMFGEFAATTSLHGYGVVGYGCDVAPSFRGKSCDAGIFMFSTGVGDAAKAFDSIYVWGREAASAGITAQANSAVGDDGSGIADGESYYNFGGVSLAPGETKSMGMYQFAFSATSDAAVYDQDKFNVGQFEGMADLVNKWAGFGRGDVNDDQVIDLADVAYLAGSVGGGNGPFPFAHLGDVNNDGAVDATDVAYMVDYYFNCGPCPVGDWTLALCTP